MSGTSLSERISWAQENLERQLDWIERHDGRNATILGIAVAMMGFLATEAPPLAKLDGSCIFFCIAFFLPWLICIGAIYLSNYPRTAAPNNSLVFFGTIASLTKEQFAADFCSRTEREHLGDLCDQAHINAIIISKKFEALKVALIFLLVSIPPWVIAIALFLTAKAN